jgi:hypothetical protein
LGSVVSGILIGAAAYLVSQLLYFVVLFSLGIGFAGMYVYYRLMRIARLNHSIVLILFGAATGLAIVFCFHYLPYLALRNAYITAAQRAYFVSPVVAGQALDKQLTKETGAAGFVGYMLLRAREGESYTNYIADGGIPLHEFSFTLKSTWAWLYWLLEALIIVLMPAWIGCDVARRPFSRGANDWYEPVPTQLGSVGLENKEQFLRLLNSGALKEAGDLMRPEEQMRHPTIEVKEQRTKPQTDQVLLSVEQTQRVGPRRVDRTILQQWEITPSQTSTLASSLRARLHTPELGPMAAIDDTQPTRKA